jgi:hypothetical protein
MFWPPEERLAAVCCDCTACTPKQPAAHVLSSINFCPICNSIDPSGQYRYCWKNSLFRPTGLSVTLRATVLQESSDDTVALINGSTSILEAAALFHDIKAGLQEDPLAIRELALCLKGNPSPHFLHRHRVSC